jgi:ankyrin repeat protein
VLAASSAQGERTPLSIASNEGHFETVKALIEQRANLEAKTAVSRILLQESCAKILRASDGMQDVKSQLERNDSN